MTILAKKPAIKPTTNHQMTAVRLISSSTICPYLLYRIVTTIDTELPQLRQLAFLLPTGSSALTCVSGYQIWYVTFAGRVSLYAAWDTYIEKKLKVLMLF